MTDEVLLHPIPNACRRLSIGRTLMYELIASERIRCVKIGRRTLIPAEELIRFAAEAARESAKAGAR